MKILFFFLCIHFAKPDDFKPIIITKGDSVVKLAGDHVTVLKDESSSQDLPWEQTKLPLDIEQGNDDQYNQYNVGDYYANKVLLNDPHLIENADRKQTYPHIKIKTVFLNEMVEQLKKY